MHNNLFFNRLVIYTNDGKIAYDETYHKGVNIIRGDNSSGKSTITHFIFFILGGAFNDWVKEAKTCSVVIAEVELNGALICLKRNITFNKDGRANDKEGIYFYWGTFENAIKSNEDWMYFGYTTYENKKSFSNVLFDNLKIPTVKGENNITFHQLLRLIYVDQESPTSSLFLYEQFDTSLTRETIAELLLGVYNQDLYDNKQRLLELDKELEDIKSEIKVIKKFNTDPSSLNPAFLLTKIKKKEEEISEIELQIISRNTNNQQTKYTKKTSLEFEVLKDEAIKSRKIITTLKDNINNIKFQIEDTQYFIDALINKLNAIRNSIKTRETLGEFTLEYCPECLSEIKQSENHSTCKLCKSPIDDNLGITKARKIEQEIDFQLKESNKIIERKERQLIELQSKYESDKLKLFQLQVKVNETLSNVSSYRDEKINQLYVDKGFIEGEILQFQTLLENAELYQKLINQKNQLEQDKEVIESQVKKLTYEQDKLKISINEKIEDKGVFLLNNDLKRQDEFFVAKEFHVDYRNNLAYISDKEAKYSASSSFYLKTSARYSIFLASLEIERMRYPRFILCDNMEDKGIEKERAQNFQRLLIKELQKKSSTTYQVIYTTSFIPDEYNNSEYCVGEFYTEKNRSLKVSQSTQFTLF